MLRRKVVGTLLAGVYTGAIATSAGAEMMGTEINSRNKKLDALLAAAMPEIKAHWKACREAGLEAMTVGATNAVDAAIQLYFERLKALDIDATDEAVIIVMGLLYKELNALNAANDYGLLETDERELLVPIFIQAAEISGIESAKYEGEPGGEFRDF